MIIKDRQVVGSGRCWQWVSCGQQIGGSSADRGTPPSSAFVMEAAWAHKDNVLERFSIMVTNTLEDNLSGKSV